LEAAAAGLGATHLFVDTAGSPAYAPARAFYLRTGYRQVAELADFFADGDAKVIFVKRLARDGE